MSLAAKIHLGPDEEIIEVVRRYALVDWWQYVLGLGMALVSTFFLPWLLQQARWGEIVFGAGLIIGVLIVVRVWFFNHVNVLVITTERLVDISRPSWLEETISSVNYLDLKEVFIHRRGLLASLFSYGDVIIATKNQQTILEIESVRRPQIIQSIINTQSDACRQRRRVVDTVSIYKNFIKILPTLSEAQMCEARDLLDAQLELLDTSDVAIDEVEDQDSEVL